MVGWMDDEALHRTLTTGRATYWSRSRQDYWRKGDTSGHVQHVREVRLDCDGDALLVLVDQVGAACHTGDRTCFDEDCCSTSTLSPTFSPSARRPPHPEGCSGRSYDAGRSGSDRVALEPAVAVRQSQERNRGTRRSGR